MSVKNPDHKYRTDKIDMLMSFVLSVIINLG
jgi:hypothetical protein